MSTMYNVLTPSIFGEYVGKSDELHATVGTRGFPIENRLELRDNRIPMDPLRFPPFENAQESSIFL
jgi:hypothetical protein